MLHFFNEINFFLLLWTTFLSEVSHYIAEDSGVGQRQLNGTASKTTLK